jgi:hypothetical protein
MWHPTKTFRTMGVRKSAIRRITALEAHINDVEGRYASLENLFNVHAATTVTAHRFMNVDPEPDKET